MTTQEQESIITLALLASFADGSKDDNEHAAIRKVLEGFQIDALNVAGLYQKVISKQASVSSAAAGLTSPEAKNLAYEVVRCVCEANGPVVPAEQAVLDQLKSSLSLAEAPEPAPASADEALDPVLLRYSILTAALEMLPQTMGSMAIVPTQMKLVYDIGRRHGIALDRNSVRDFGAALGIGAVSQVLEAGMRRVLAGVLGGVAGKTGEQVGEFSGSVAGTALTFATTYALGTIADRYYAEGRKMDVPTLKAEFSKLVEKARALQSQYTTTITDKSRELSEKFKNMDVSAILNGILQGKA